MLVLEILRPWTIIKERGINGLFAGSNENLVGEENKLNDEAVQVALN